MDEGAATAEGALVLERLCRPKVFFSAVADDAVG
ncbi:MAG: hypothetical protein QOI34_659, partial [Verrucomicrobiota bacterium]